MFPCEIAVIVNWWTEEVTLGPGVKLTLKEVVILEGSSLISEGCAISQLGFITATDIV